MSRPSTPSLAHRSLPWLAMGGILGALIWIALAWPAVWLAASVQAWTGQRVGLVSAQGNLWQGQARVVLASDRQTWHALPGLWSWHLRPIWSGGPGLALTILSDCCLNTPFHLVWRPLAHGQWTMAPLKGQADAGWLSSLGAPWNTLGLRARIDWQSDQLQGQWGWQGLVLSQGQIRVTVSELSSTLTAIAPLGRYHVDLMMQTPFQWTLQTLEGPLQLSGKGNWTGSQPRFRGQAEALGPHSDSLHPLLSVMGQRQGARADLNF